MRFALPQLLSQKHDTPHKFLWFRSACHNECVLLISLSTTRKKSSWTHVIAALGARMHLTRPKFLLAWRDNDDDDNDEGNNDDADDDDDDGRWQMTHACSCLSQWWHERLQLFVATSAILAERATLHCLLHIHGSCLLHMQHAMTTHTTLTHGGFLISRYIVVWGPRWYHVILKLLDLGHRTSNRWENNSGWPMPPNTEHQH